MDLQQDAEQNLRLARTTRTQGTRGHLSLLSFENGNGPARKRKRTNPAITFNLGYLPKGDKSITTEPETTLTALRSAYEWLGRTAS